MNLDLSETQILLGDTLGEFLDREVPFSRIRSIDAAGSWDEDLWEVLVERGWLALPFQEALGGGGGSLLEAGILVEKLSRRAVVVPLVEVLAAALTLQQFGEPQPVEALIRGVIEGSAIPVPSLLESSDRFDRVALEADADGSLRGEKLFVDYGQFATHHLVAARNREGPGLYLVDVRHASVKQEPLHSIGRTPQAIVRYDRVPAQLLCGSDGLAQLIRLGRAFASVQCLALMEQALEMTVAYASLREQFGRPIGSFQAVQHHCANMATLVESARFLVYEALDALDHSRATDSQIALAKAAVSRAIPEVTMLAQQIHGGNGFIEENDLYFFTIRGKERSLAWGTAEECLAIVSDSIETAEPWL